MEPNNKIRILVVFDAFLHPLPDPGFQVAAQLAEPCLRLLQLIDPALGRSQIERVIACILAE